jgi:hypothetical protein
MTEGFVNWKKSSRSGTATDNCVEVATNGPAVGVRDSKDRGIGPVLRFDASAWTSFVATVRAGRHDI